jgi:hypothetical protein
MDTCAASWLGWSLWVVCVALRLQRIAMTLTRMHATDTCLAVATP